jgi:hypothetical protein
LQCLHLYMHGTIVYEQNSFLTCEFFIQPWFVDAWKENRWNVLSKKLRVHGRRGPWLNNQIDTHSEPFNFKFSLHGGIPLRANQNTVMCSPAAGMHATTDIFQIPVDSVVNCLSFHRWRNGDPPLTAIFLFALTNFV